MINKKIQLTFPLLLHLNSSSGSNSPHLKFFPSAHPSRTLTTQPTGLPPKSQNKKKETEKMPILQFYTSPNQLTSDEKAELVKTITERYTLRLPAFFVNVMFNEVSLLLPITHHPLSSPPFPHHSFFLSSPPKFKMPTDRYCVRVAPPQLLLRRRQTHRREVRACDGRSHRDELGEGEWTRERVFGVVGRCFEGEV
jgi:hypothetical protein